MVLAEQVTEFAQVVESGPEREKTASYGGGVSISSASLPEQHGSQVAGLGRRGPEVQNP
jgi:hypothetical protein